MYVYLFIILYIYFIAILPRQRASFVAYVSKIYTPHLARFNSHNKIAVYFLKLYIKYKKNTDFCTNEHLQRAQTVFDRKRDVFASSICPNITHGSEISDTTISRMCWPRHRFYSRCNSIFTLNRIRQASGPNWVQFITIKFSNSFELKVVALKWHIGSKCAARTKILQNKRANECERNLCLNSFSDIFQVSLNHLTLFSTVFLWKSPDPRSSLNWALALNKLSSAQNYECWHFASLHSHSPH